MISNVFIVAANTGCWVNVVLKLGQRLCPALKQYCFGHPDNKIHRSNAWLKLGKRLQSQQKQNICITFIQCRTNVEDVGPTLYKCYANVLCLLGCLMSRFCLHNTSDFSLLYMLNQQLEYSPNVYTTWWMLRAFALKETTHQTLNLIVTYHRLTIIICG